MVKGAVVDAAGGSAGAGVGACFGEAQTYMVGRAGLYSTFQALSPIRPESMRLEAAASLVESTIGKVTEWLLPPHSSESSAQESKTAHK